MGKDGHIASLFPYSKNLKEKFIVKAVIGKDFKRITLGLKVINNSNKIYLLLNNKTKTAIYEKIAKEGKLIPVNNLKKNKIFCFKVK